MDWIRVAWAGVFLLPDPTGGTEGGQNGRPMGLNRHPGRLHEVAEHFLQRHGVAAHAALREE